MFKSGFVTIIGRPNVGKSTFLNLLLGEKIAIVSEKPQTTRNKITGIKNLPEGQVVFIDTPGIHYGRKPLNELIVKRAVSTLEEVDLILFMIEAKRPKTTDEDIILNLLRRVKSPVLLIINKIDLVEKASLLPIIKEYSDLYSFKEIIPISCLTLEGFDNIMDMILSCLPMGEPYFPPDMITDLTERFLVSELIREKIFLLTREEVPYSTAVVVDQFREDKEKRIIHIMASIYVERKSQKGILIGKGGRMLKEIGSRAREDIERLLGSRVFLKLWVGVRKDWTMDTRKLKEFVFRDN